ncbi:MAG: ferredoxin--NADP reductase [Sterolibacterium sp.]|nr:ferredoxin--NADP reductase [Sterolibacterium sp.]
MAVNLAKPGFPVGVDQRTVEAATKWSEEHVLALHRWSPTLFSVRTTRSSAFRFTPGQFARLGIVDEAGGALIWRAYSMASANYDEHLEFFSILVPDGAFTSRLTNIAPGAPILVEKASYGFLTADRFVGGRDLWLLATGTGLAPFLSILHDPAVWDKYENIILVYSVRYASELAYQDEIAALPARELLRDGRAHLHYVPVVTREPVAGALSARITQLITEGRLEEVVGLPLEIEHSRLMICGNPQMALDLREVLTGRGFRTGRRGVPGQLAFENYW